MEQIKRIVIELHGEIVEIVSGVCEGEEKEKIKKFITGEYKRRGYIPGHINTLEDEFDAGSVYFQTLANSVPIAAARLIEANPLPTQSIFYRMDVPWPLRRFPPKSLREVSRLTASRRPGQNPLPRHLASTAMISAIVDYGFKMGFCGGMSTIKLSFLHLFNRLKLPALHEIKGAKLIYPPDGILAGFFYDEEKPPVPIYYLQDEAKAIFDGLWRSIERTGKTLFEEEAKLLDHEVLI